MPLFPLPSPPGGSRAHPRNDVTPALTPPTPRRGDPRFFRWARQPDAPDLIVAALVGLDGFPSVTATRDSAAAFPAVRISARRYSPGSRPARSSAASIRATRSSSEPDGGGATRRRRRRVAAEQLTPPLLALAGAPRLALHELTGGETVQRLLDLRPRAEAVQALASLTQLRRRLRSPQHQDREQRDLAVVEVERVVEQVPELRRAAARPARESRPPAVAEPRQRLTDLVLVVVDDRVAVGRPGCRRGAARSGRAGTGRASSAASRPGSRGRVARRGRGPRA